MLPPVERRLGVPSPPSSMLIHAEEFATETMGDALAEHCPVYTDWHRSCVLAPIAKGREKGKREGRGGEGETNSGEAHTEAPRASARLKYNCAAKYVYGGAWVKFMSARHTRASGKCILRLSACRMQSRQIVRRAAPRRQETKRARARGQEILIARLMRERGQTRSGPVG